MINYNRWFRNMELLGYTIMVNWNNPRFLKTTLIITNKEFLEMQFIEKEIMEYIINDIVEACKEDLESKDNNCNPEKIIRELVNEEWL